MEMKNVTGSFDEIFSRFPHLSQAIFNEVDNNSLTDCRKVSRTWKNVIDHEKFHWLRRIQNYRGAFEPFLRQWNQVIRRTPIQEIKELCLATEHFFKLGKKIMVADQYSPLHVAAELGLIDLCRRIIEATDYQNNNACFLNLTPLHLAAENGHLEVCRLILDNVASKNPVAFNGVTPLHCAANRGHSDIVKLLVENQVDIRPLFNGKTPLELAAYNHHRFCCKFLIKNWQDFWQYWWAPRFQDPNRVFVPLPPMN